MEGVEAVVDRVMWRLQDAIPGKLAELRTRYSVLDGSLEDITNWLTHEPDDIAIDRPPMIVVVEQDSDTVDGPVRVSADGGSGTTFKWRYQLVVFAWARGETFDATSQVRRRYGLAVRECLLQMPGLGATDPGTIVLDPSSIQESFSAVARDGQTREIIAATSLALTYYCEETLGPRIPATGVATVPIVPDIGVVGP